MSDPFGYLGLFKNIIILHTEPDPMAGRIKYFAAGKKFDVVPDGQIIPEYTAIFENGNTSPRWERVKGE